MTNNNQPHLISTPVILHNTINIILLGLNPTHYNIIRNLIEMPSKSIHIFARPNFISSSRFPFKFEDYPLDEKLLPILRRMAEKLDGPKIIIPATDGELHFLDTHRADLEPHFFLCISNSTPLSIVSDKFQIETVLKKSGLNYPKSICVDNRMSSLEALSKISFPCIVKPVFSREWKTAQASKIIGENKVFIINSMEELSFTLKQVSTISTQLLVQEIIPQKKFENYSFCAYADAKGKILHSFVTQKLVQYPDRFGTAVLCQTTNNTLIEEYGRRAIKTLGLNGISETEIIIDQRTNRPYIIEVNPRHWMQHRLSTRLGVNYTLLDIYYRIGMKKHVKTCLSDHTPRKQIIWLDDIGYVIYAVKHFFNPGKCFLKQVFFLNREYALFSFHDVRPFLNSLKSKLSRTLIR